MRLRRETGDFQIKITTSSVDDNPPTINAIKPGLDIEDLIGELVLIHTIGEMENEETGELEVLEKDGICSVSSVAEAPDNSSLLLLSISSELLPPIEIAYDKETGELSVANYAGSHVAPGIFTPVEGLGEIQQDVT